MAKVHPLPTVDVASSSYVSAKRESFTVWMKSLVIQGNGCTVFNENGEIVYRIDNYDNKGSNEVYLMDLRGQVLFTILRKVWSFGQWKAYKGDRSNLMNKEKPKFQVTKKGHITLMSNNDEASCYKLEASAGRSAFKIVDCRGGVLVAEARRKQSASGVLLGDDVLNLVVEPHVDHSFIMALVTVYGLMHHRM
ncbi:Protein LURP-one-related like [Melia azedarach]|uniref:Protein LURP-one-related like n=1 Tax=Melia azedarach TaxID=155640 RepID=A0ACC1XL80_MELAZ|nr:Protein LURP-one-related like [Melia azedarach]